jgi:hypothetical protein
LIDNQNQVVLKNKSMNCCIVNKRTNENRIPRLLTKCHQNLKQTIQILELLAGVRQIILKPLAVASRARNCTKTERRRSQSGIELRIRYNHNCTEKVNMQTEPAEN